MATVEELKRLAADKAVKYGVDPKVFLKQMGHESSWNPSARGTSGEIGLGQFMPNTGAAYGLKTEADFLDPDKNLDAAARYMSDNLKKTKGNYTEALSIYNGGSPNEYKTNPITKNYVNTLMGPIDPNTPGTRHINTPIAPEVKEAKEWETYKSLTPIESFKYYQDQILPESKKHSAEVMDFLATTKPSEYTQHVASTAPKASRDITSTFYNNYIIDEPKGTVEGRVVEESGLPLELPTNTRGSGSTPILTSPGMALINSGKDLINSDMAKQAAAHPYYTAGSVVTALGLTIGGFLVTGGNPVGGMLGNHLSSTINKATSVKLGMTTPEDFFGWRSQLGSVVQAGIVGLPMAAGSAKGISLLAKAGLGPKAINAVGTLTGSNPTASLTKNFLTGATYEVGSEFGIAATETGGPPSLGQVGTALLLSGAIPIATNAAGKAASNFKSRVDAKTPQQTTQVPVVNEGSQAATIDGGMGVPTKSTTADNLASFQPVNEGINSPGGTQNLPAITIEGSHPTTQTRPQVQPSPNPIVSGRHALSPEGTLTRAELVQSANPDLAHLSVEDLQATHKQISDELKSERGKAISEEGGTSNINLEKAPALESLERTILELEKELKVRKATDELLMGESFNDQSPLIQSQANLVDTSTNMTDSNVNKGLDLLGTVADGMENKLITKPKIDHEATLTVQDTMRGIHEGKGKQEVVSVEDGVATTKEIPITREDVDIEVQLMEAAANKGRLTPEEFNKSYLGQQIDTGTKQLINARLSTKEGQIEFIASIRNLIDGDGQAVQIGGKPDLTNSRRVFNDRSDTNVDWKYDSDEALLVHEASKVISNPGKYDDNSIQMQSYKYLSSSGISDTDISLMKQTLLESKNQQLRPTESKAPKVEEVKPLQQQLAEAKKQHTQAQETISKQREELYNDDFVEELVEDLVQTNQYLDPSAHLSEKAFDALVERVQGGKASKQDIGLYNKVFSNDVETITIPEATKAEWRSDLRRDISNGNIKKSLNPNAKKGTHLELSNEAVTKIQAIESSIDSAKVKAKDAHNKNLTEIKNTYKKQTGTTSKQDVINKLVSAQDKVVDEMLLRGDSPDSIVKFQQALQEAIDNGRYNELLIPNSKLAKTLNLSDEHLAALRDAIRQPKSKATAPIPAGKVEVTIKTPKEIVDTISSIKPQTMGDVLNQPASTSDFATLADIVEQSTDLNMLKHINKATVEVIEGYLERNSLKADPYAVRRTIGELYDKAAFAKQNGDIQTAQQLEAVIAEVKAAYRMVINGFEPRVLNDVILRDGQRVSAKLKEAYGDNINVRFMNGNNQIEVSWANYNPNAIAKAPAKTPMVRLRDAGKQTMYDAAVETQNTARQAPVQNKTSQDSLTETRNINSSEHNTGTVNTHAENLEKSFGITFDKDSGGISGPHTPTTHKVMNRLINTVNTFFEDTVDYFYGHRMYSQVIPGKRLTFANVVAQAHNKYLKNGAIYQQYAGEFAAVSGRGGLISELSPKAQEAYINLKAQDEAYLEVANILREQGNTEGGIKMSPAEILYKIDEITTRQADKIRANLEYNQTAPTQGKLKLDDLTVDTPTPNSILKQIAVPKDPRVLVGKPLLGKVAEYNAIVNATQNPEAATGFFVKVANSIAQGAFNANVQQHAIQLGLKKTKYLNNEFYKAGAKFSRWSTVGKVATQIANVIQASSESFLAASPAYHAALREVDLPNAKVSAEGKTWLKDNGYDLRGERVVGWELAAEERSMTVSDTSTGLDATPTSWGGKLANVFLKAPTVLNRMHVEHARARAAKNAMAITEKLMLDSGNTSPLVREQIFNETFSELLVASGDSLRALVTSPVINKGILSKIEMRTVFNAISDTAENLHAGNTNQGAGGSIGEAVGLTIKGTNEFFLQRYTGWFYDAIARQNKTLQNTIKAANTAPDKLTAAKEWAQYGAGQLAMVGIFGVGYNVAVSSIYSAVALIAELFDNTVEIEDRKRALDRYTALNAFNGFSDTGLSYEKFSSDSAGFLSIIVANVGDIAETGIDARKTTGVFKGDRDIEFKSFYGTSIQEKTRMLGKMMDLVDQGDMTGAAVTAVEAALSLLQQGNVVRQAKRGYGAAFEGTAHVPGSVSVYELSQRGFADSGALYLNHELNMGEKLYAGWSILLGAEFREVKEYNQQVYASENALMQNIDNISENLTRSSIPSTKGL